MLVINSAYFAPADDDVFDTANNCVAVSIDPPCASTRYDVHALLR